MNFKVENEQEEIDKLLCASKDLKKQLEDMMRSIVIQCVSKEDSKKEDLKKETAA